jgi:hypothetical protein
VDFPNPIDSEILGNKIYALEYGGNQGIWEITFPPAVSGSDTPLLTKNHVKLLGLGLVLLACLALRSRKASWA